ncbi:MAG: 3-hydroxyacyl-ACP dehydratase FabZ [Rickettsiella sp.]|nr:3-hydroxyacyl-ACP dehydratase FabZ [Rickettsiella sp.]
MNTPMDIQEILNYLPQRYPILMIDKVSSIEPSKSIVAIKNVTVNEPHFLGHFPGNPIMPGVLILEAMAQATGILALYSNKERNKEGFLYLFAGIDNVRFRRQVVPGDQLRIEAHVLKVKGDVWKCKVKAEVDNELVCEAEIMGVGQDTKKDTKL